MKHDWEYKKLGEVATYINGYAFKPEEWMDNGLPIIRIQNLNNDNAPFNYYNGEIPSKYIINTGDLLISWSASLGAYIWKGEKAYLNQHIFKVEFDKSDISKFYLKLVVESKLAEMSKSTHGATMKHITKKDFDNVPIPVPPLSTQQSIVSELDSLSQIIADCKETLKDYDALEQSIFYDMIGDPVKNEKGWEVKKLGDCYKVTSSKRIYLEELTDNGIPFLKVADVNNLINGECKPTTFISDEKYNELKINGYVPKANDLIVTARGTIGNVYIVKKEDAFYFQDGMITWLKQSNYNTDAIFIKNMFLVPCFLNYLEQFSNNSTVAFLSISKLANVYIPVPPLALQQTFASKIEAIEEMKVETKKALLDAETLFQARMDYWFN